MHTVNSDTSPEYVFIKILNLLKLHFERRDNLIEKELAEPLKPKSVKFYEKIVHIQAFKIRHELPNKSC